MNGSGLGLLGSFGMLIFAIGWATAFFLAVWLPYMAFSVTRNIRQIRIQLERLNDTLESRLSADGPTPFTSTSPLTSSRLSARPGGVAKSLQPLG